MPSPAPPDSTLARFIHVRARTQGEGASSLAAPNGANSSRAVHTHVGWVEHVAHAPVNELRHVEHAIERLGGRAEQREVASVEQQQLVKRGEDLLAWLVDGDDLRGRAEARCGRPVDGESVGGTNASRHMSAAAVRALGGSDTPHHAPWSGPCCTSRVRRSSRRARRLRRALRWARREEGGRASPEHTQPRQPDAISASSSTSSGASSSAPLWPLLCICSRHVGFHPCPGPASPRRGRACASARH